MRSPLAVLAVAASFSGVAHAQNPLTQLGLDESRAQSEATSLVLGCTTPSWADATAKRMFKAMPASARATVTTGLWAWAKTAASDLFPDGITLNTVCPGLHSTDRIKVLGLAQPGDVLGDPADFGRVVTFLCSEPANYVTGAALLVDGGRFPALF